MSQEQVAVLEDIKRIQSQTGQSLEALAQGFQAAEQRALAEQGLPGIVEDIAAANAVLADATAAAQVEKDTDAAAALARLRGIADSMIAELPARLVARHCERALVYLHLDTPKITEASAELTTAYDIVRVDDPAVVQELLNQAKSHLARGDTVNAARVIEGTIAKAAGDRGTAMLMQMAAGLDGADAALQRRAWPVLKAELAEIDRVLDALSGKVHFSESMAGIQPPPAPAADAADTTTDAGETTEAAGAGAAAATPAPTAPAQPGPAPATAPVATGDVATPAPATAPRATEAPAPPAPVAPQ